jgi:hypothetical protein
MRGDLLYYRQDLRHQLIDILQEEDAEELGKEGKHETV